MVGVDGSPSAAAASRWAARLAVCVKAELVVASAWRPTQAEVSPDELVELRTDAGSLLDGPWCDPARGAGITPQPLFLEGSPDRLLEAAREHAALLVVGSRGAGGFASLHLGSVAHHLARHTTVPLAIVPEPSADTDPDMIVVGVDGSPGSAAAVAWCAEVAPALGARVTAVMALEWYLEWVPESNPRSWRRQAEHDLSAWVEPLRRSRVAVETEIVRDNHPVAAIAESAATHDARLIVVGTHGLGGFTHMRLGGVAVQLVHHTGLPVVLVPEKAQASTGRVA